MGRKQSVSVTKRDAEWRDSVRKRDNYTCQVCGKVPSRIGCHAHHIIPRQLKLCRWDTMNGITLCYSCHKVGAYSAHQNAVWFTLWLMNNKPETYRYIITLLNKMSKFGKNGNGN